jgi:arsenate reductase (thioredoxin)
MHKISVLFVCIHNSARSQMAEAFLRELGRGRFEVESAGLEPGRLNPLVVEAMRQVGIDLGGAATRSVFDLFKAGRRFHYVISVCDEASAERCPIFPGAIKRLNWNFRDPSRFTGSEEQRLAQTIEVREAIRARVRRWIEEVEEANTALSPDRGEGT